MPNHEKRLNLLNEVRHLFENGSKIIDKRTKTRYFNQSKDQIGVILHGIKIKTEGLAETG